ncbi:TPA: MBL fold metallo-hydrolase [Bacillus cereus]|nr:MBL fold metallo-hydrolase [Bacillus cereus]HDR7066666.1 MBL fold metallo-hydrolase [Bacillus cereus]
MTGVTLKIFPASYGDSFLFSCNVNKKAYNILIDTGFAKTYDKFLKRELRSISNKGEKLDILINTHIHLDHIGGALKFLKENREGNIIEIDEIWHNGLEQIRTLPYDEGFDEIEEEIVEEIIRRGYEVEVEDEEISAIKGVSLSALIEEGGYSLNTFFKNGKIVADRVPRIELDSNTSILILSPTTNELTELETEWVNCLDERKFNFKLPKDKRLKDAFEFVLSRLKEYYIRNEEISTQKELEGYYKLLLGNDNSVVNRSSIAFIIENFDKKFLFLSDASINTIEKSLQVLVEREKYELNFEMIKLSHHGSKYNIDGSFLEKVTAKDFIISTNGEKFQHPDYETLANLVMTNPTNRKTIIFNYPIDKAFYLNNEEWKRKYNYTVCINEEDRVLERRY